LWIAFDVRGTVIYVNACACCMCMCIHVHVHMHVM
jgi:hypothetical protein